MQNSIVKVSKCFNIFYSIFTQVLDKIENFEFPRNAQCLLSASLNLIHLHSHVFPTNHPNREWSLYCQCIKLHSHQTADQPTTNDNKFLWLCRVWSGKKLPALIEERIYPQSTPAVSAPYPWCTHAQILLSSIYPRPSGWPILYNQPRTYSWYNYAHYAQYRTNPPPPFLCKSK